MELHRSFPIAIIDEDFDGKSAAGRGMRSLAEAIEKQGFRVVGGIAYEDARRLVHVFNTESCWLISVDGTEDDATRWQVLEEVLAAKRRKGVKATAMDIIHATRDRGGMIMIVTLSTMASLVPMAWGSASDTMFGAIALATAGGMIAGTIAALWLIPPWLISRWPLRGIFRRKHHATGGGDGGGPGRFKRLLSRFRRNKELEPVPSEM